MAYQFIRLERQGSVAILTLNRPEKRNALSVELVRELGEALDEVNDDHDVSVLILTGAGASFSSGFDIGPGSGKDEVPSTADWDVTNLGPKTLMKLWNLRQPTISAVNGYAVAAGNVLAMTADIVVAAEDAHFGEPEIRHVQHSPAILLPYMIPLRHLHYLYYTGDIIDARTAEKWNMVNKVVPTESLMEEAMKVAERIAKVPPYATQMMKRSIKGTYDKMGFSEAFEQHLMIRMIEIGAPNVPEKLAFDEIRAEHGMRVFLEARDAPFRDE